MKIYRVKVTCETIVLAENEQDAIERAIHTARNEDDPMHAETAHEVKSVSELPPGWNRQCFPWGVKESPMRTIGDILEGESK